MHRQNSYNYEHVGGAEIGWECCSVLLQSGRPQAAHHAILTNYQKSHLLGRCTLHAANTSLYVACSTISKLKKSTFAYEIELC